MPRAAEKLARPESGDDAFMEVMTPLAEKLEQNWKLIATVAGVILVSAVAVAIGMSIAAHHEEEDARLLGQALVQATKPVVGDPGASQDSAADYFASEQVKQEALAKALEGVEKTAAGSASARTALLTLGDADCRLGKFPDALQHYERYLELSPATDTLRAFALQGQAYALLGEGKGDDALQTAKRLVDEPPAGFGRDLGLMAEGRIAEQLGRAPAARDAYTKLTVDFPNSPAGREATARLAALGVTPQPPSGPAALPR